MVNALVIVTDDKEVVFRKREDAGHGILNGVDVLKLIHQDVSVYGLPFMARLRVCGEKLIAHGKHVIEIEQALRA